MTIDEAIRIDTVLKGAPVLKDDERIIKALNLSVQALKRIRELRLIRLFGYDTTLAGETKE